MWRSIINKVVERKSIGLTNAGASDWENWDAQLMN